MKSRRERIREKQQSRRRLNQIIIGVIALVIVIGSGYVLWRVFRPSVGEAVEIMADTSHVEIGTDPGPYNSNPPTSGPHYPTDLEAGFYNPQNISSLGEFPEGYLVHSLEHGYVIFWYDCEELVDEDCGTLQGRIQSVMDEYDSTKLIAFPYPSLDVPLAMTSWGRIQPFEEFDERTARLFVERNRNRSPEPNAP